LTGALVVAAAYVGAQDTPITPTRFDEAIVQLVAQLMQRDHLSKPRIDDEVSRKWFKNFVDMLDPLKQYFLKADVDEFAKQADNLDDLMRKGDLGFAKTVFERYLQRSDERLDDATELLKTKPDFTVDESMVDDAKRLDWPADRAEARDRMRKYVKLMLLQRKIEGEDLDKATQQLLVRFKDRNRFYHQFDISELLEVYLTAMTTVMDPHSSYMGARNLEDMMNNTLNLSLEGIGASLTVEDGFPVVKEVVPGGAADRDGRLQEEDKILGKLNEDGSRDSFVGKKLADVVRKIRGPKGTKVQIVVQPAGSQEEKTYELTRERIELATEHAKAQVIKVQTDLRAEPVKMGVLRIPGFYGDTDAMLKGDPNPVSVTRDCRKYLEGFKKDGVDVVLVDLRGNGGGLLSEAIDLSGLFIDQGPVVQVRYPGGRKHLDDDNPGTSWDGPMAVLIDKASASASEIFAGVIKDYSRGLIIGDESSYGKGTVQQILHLNELIARGGKDVPKLGALKLTIQQFYRPNGESTQVHGVKPDIHIPSARDHADFGEGKNDSALTFDKLVPLAHDLYNLVPEPLVSKLSGRSSDRRGSDPKFQEDDKYIAKLIERKARHEVSLNEAKFREETRRDELADGEEHPKKRGRFSPDEGWKADDYYNKEVAQIVADYLILGQPILVAAPVRVPNPGEDLAPQVP
jgi:carboxyl-terminal processing protease